MRVFVIGGTGAIGGHAVPALLRAGHQVTALSRSPEKSERLRRQGAMPLTVSIFDRNALARAFAGHDAVVNLSSAIPPTADFMRRRAWAANDRVRSEGSAAVAGAAIAAGVGRVVQESVCMIYRDRGRDWIDEDWATDRFPMALPNHAAESSVSRFTAAGGIGVVLRFGWFYGPGAAHSEEFFALARQGLAIMMGARQDYVSSIHVEDAGAAVSAALSIAAGIYNIVDDEPLAKGDYADAMAKAAGRRHWLRVPGRFALLLGDRSTSLTRSLRVSNARFKAVTRWTPLYPSAREGWQAMGNAAVDQSP
jgi:nucleoside-diphosphate-sugar epimerase